MQRRLKKKKDVINFYLSRFADIPDVEVRVTTLPLVVISRVNCEEFIPPTLNRRTSTAS